MSMAAGSAWNTTLDSPIPRSRPRACCAARRVLGTALPLTAIRAPSCLHLLRSSPRRSSESPALRRRSRSPEREKSAKGVRFTESRKVEGVHGHPGHTASPAPGVGEWRGEQHAHEWVDHEGWGGAESIKPKDYTWRVSKVSRLVKQDPAHRLHVLASQTITENHRILPARLRALERRKHSRLSLTAPPPHDATTLTRASVPPGESRGLSPEPQVAGTADYHPAPFTPGKVPAIYTTASPPWATGRDKKVSRQYGAVFNRPEAKAGEPLMHWRDGLLTDEDPAHRNQTLLRATIRGDSGGNLAGHSSPELPSDLLSVAPDGSEKLCSKAALDLDTLAEWLNDSRPIDQAGAYSMLLLAKDLIRRLLSESVQVWNQKEDELQRQLADEQGTMQNLQQRLQHEQALRQAEAGELARKLDALEKKTRHAHRLTLQADLRADKMERDYLLARDEVVQLRERAVKLEARVREQEVLLAKSVWNDGKVDDLVASLKTQPIRTRRKVAYGIIEQEAEAGTCYMFCKEMPQNFKDPALDHQISVAFAMHLVEGSDDPMQILRDLTAQRQRVLGRRGEFSFDARRKSVGSQTDPLPEPKPVIIKEKTAPKRRSFIEAKPPPKITPKEEEVLQEIIEAPQPEPEPEPKPEPEPEVAETASPVHSMHEAKRSAGPASPKTPQSKSQSAASSAKSKINSRRSTPAHKGEMLPGAILKWIPQILEAKLVQDEVDLNSGRRLSSMRSFIEDFFPRKYGLPALAKKAAAEFFNGLKKYLPTNKRLQIFGACCNIDSDDKEFSYEFMTFFLKCVARCFPIDVVNEKLSKKECEVEVETVNRALEVLFQADLQPVTPSFRENVISLCKVGKHSKNQPAVDVDEFLGLCMQEFCAIKGKDPPPSLMYLQGAD